MSTFVLVHGGTHAAWCWEPLVGPLQQAGHHVVAPDLPGRGPDAAAAATVTLDDYLRVVGDAVTSAASHGPVVLVGHSMGGVTVSGVAERMPEAVATAVFVSAIVPGSGGAGLATLQEAAGTSLILEEGVLAFSPDQTTVTVDPARAPAVFYHRCDPADADRAVARLCPEPVAPMATPLTLTPAGFGTVPCRYLGGTDDRCVPPGLQRSVAERWDMAFEAIDADHSPFLSMTAGLADLLLASA